MTERSFWLRILVVAVLPFLLWQDRANQATPSVAAPETAAVATSALTSTSDLPQKKPVDTRESFIRFANGVLDTLPTLAVLENPDRDPHRPPPELLEGGVGVGSVSEKLEKQPERIREALAFYYACALKNEVLPALRAVCLRNLMDRAERADLAYVVNRDEFPERILFIADLLPATR